MTRMTMEVEAGKVRVGDEVTYVAKKRVRLTGRVGTIFSVDAKTHPVFIDFDIDFDPNRGAPTHSFYRLLDDANRFEPTDSPLVTVTREAVCANCGGAIVPCSYVPCSYEGVSHSFSNANAHFCTEKWFGKAPGAALPDGARWADTREAPTREGGIEGGTREAGMTREAALLRAELLMIMRLRLDARELNERIEALTIQLEDEYRDRAREAL